MGRSQASRISPNSQTALRGAIVAFVIATASASSSPARAAADPYAWLVGTWTCQIDTAKWGPMKAVRSGPHAVKLSWSWGDDGSGEEEILSPPGAPATLDGRADGGSYARSTFVGDATELGPSGSKSYRLKVEFIQTGAGELAEWRSVPAGADWRTTSSRHCALGRTPHGIVY